MGADDCLRIGERLLQINGDMFVATPLGARHNQTRQSRRTTTRSLGYVTVGQVAAGEVSVTSSGTDAPLWTSSTKARAASTTIPKTFA